ncbi:hypothetical protein [Vulcanisaeta thermophila]|uniref:hypothetical protein n=1 Tax=Vulcanisaeta thermophila TaxID=867917 RepID=UPI000852EDD5|nr:hypothetical protein [Vulcanisaeta thermophila]
MSLERLYSMLREIDAKVDEVYKLRDSEETQINKLIDELRAKVQEEVERYIKTVIDEYKNTKYKELDEEMRRYSENVNRELEEFRRRINEAVDRVVDEVVRLLLSG